MLVYCFISGSPAMLVSKESIPARAEVLITVAQCTPESMAVVPIEAMAVCATVLIALIDAALNHFKKLSLFIFSTPYFTILFTSD